MFKRYKNICVLNTPYALLVYLLEMSLEDINDTLFFVCEDVDKNIVERLPHYVKIKNKCNWSYRLYLRLFKYFYCWSYPSTTKYVQDHLRIASILIGHYQYTNISDAPNCYMGFEQSIYQPSVAKNIGMRIKNYISHGPMFDLKYGTSKQCINRWITGLEDINSKFIKGKAYKYIDGYTLWQNASQTKKDLILRIFGVNPELTSLLTCETLILTQPFCEDCKLTDQEMYDVYAPYIKSSKVVIKRHPRDRFDWQKHFKDIHIINEPIPMQLLIYLGFNPEVAITVSSSAITDLPKTTQKIMIGTKVNDKIYKMCGDLYN